MSVTKTKYMSVTKTQYMSVTKSKYMSVTSRNSHTSVFDYLAIPVLLIIFDTFIAGSVTISIMTKLLIDNCAYM